MASVIGDALVWLLSGIDVLKLLGSFTLGVGLIYTLITAWKYVEGSRDDGGF